MGESAGVGIWQDDGLYTRMSISDLAEMLRLGMKRITNYPADQ